MGPHASSLGTLNDDERGFQDLKGIHFLELCTAEKNYLYDLLKKRKQEQCLIFYAT
jgi:hypothetical protein